MSIEQLCLAQKGFLLGHMMQNWGVGQKFTSTQNFRKYRKYSTINSTYFVREPYDPKEFLKNSYTVSNYR